MAACPDVSPLPRLRRRPLTLTQRRLEANRRNAARSTGPRTARGKARVARNAIKHGFFVGQERWTPAQHRDFEALLDGLRDDVRPEGIIEESCVRTIAESYVRMAAVLRYENIAAHRHHQERDRELDRHIAAADAPNAAWLGARRERLRRAGWWKPTIPGEREAKAILRYLGCLERTIEAAASYLIAQKQTHYSATPNSGPEALRRAYAQRLDDSATPNSGPEALRRAYAQRFDDSATPNSGPEVATPSEAQHDKTNPLSSTFTGDYSAALVQESVAPERRAAVRRAHPHPEPNTQGVSCPDLSHCAAGGYAAATGEGRPENRKNKPTSGIEEIAKTNPLSSMFPGNRHQRRRAKALARRP